MWVCYHDNSKLRALIFHQTGPVDEGSDHLQLIKFWPSCAPMKGVCDRAKIFWLHVIMASAQCLRLSESFSFLLEWTLIIHTSLKFGLLHCALAAAQCIVISPICLFVGVWVGLLP